MGNENVTAMGFYNYTHTYSPGKTRQFLTISETAALFCRFVEKAIVVLMKLGNCQ